MKIAIYTKDDGGMLTRQRVETWNNLHEAVEHYTTYYGTGLHARNEALIGWPETSVTWYGNGPVASESLGIAIVD